MFTGIIQEVGRIDKITRGSSLTTLGVSAKKVWQDAQVSDSIAINGVCLTVTDKKDKLLFFQAVAPTLKASNLKRLKKGDLVNLEPALKVGDKLGGHFVLGHVDGEVRLRRKIKQKDYWRMEIDMPSAFRKFLRENGSVALEGISLTVKKIMARFFTVDIIPFTYEHTTLKDKKAGDRLNVEFDHLIKQGV